MTTLTPEKEARLLDMIGEFNGEGTVVLSPSVAAEHADDVRSALSTLSTERQAREAAEKEVERLSGGFAPDGKTWREFGLDQAARRGDAEAKLAALVEAIRPIVRAYEQGADFDTLGAVTAPIVRQLALSALPPPVPTEEAETSTQSRPISSDGPHAISEHRHWLARQLLDSKLDDDEAFGIVAYHPSVTDIWKPQAQDVAGLVEGDLEWLRKRKEDIAHHWPKTADVLAFVAEHNARIDRILAALRGSPISHEDRPLELAAADNNHKALVEEKDGWLPIALAPTDGQWRYVRLPDGSEAVAAFEGDALGPRARRWRTKAFAYHNPSRPSGETRGGVEQFTQAYDTFVISDLPDGVYPTHFRPNDTVYGSAETQALAAFQSRQEGKQP